jgi:spoIIIJ-associated protein
MMNKTDSKKIKKTVEEFFQKLGVEAKIDVFPLKESTIPVELKLEEPQTLIGQNGETLFEIQHLLKIILKRQISDTVYVDLDINNYKKKKAEYLRELAKSTADEVSLSRHEKLLPSMTPYERRIVHVELSQRQDIRTASIGEEPRRKVIVRPAV